MWSNDNNQAWPMPSAYQNMSHDQIDWAALAQQWIQMKEVQNSLAPEQNSSAYYAGQGLNGGEAPMEVVKDDEEDSFLPRESSNFTSAPPPPSAPHPPLPPHPPVYPLMPTRPPPTNFANFPGPNRQATPHRPPSNFPPYPRPQPPPAAPLRPVSGHNMPGFPPRFAGGPPGPFSASNVQGPPPGPWPPAYAPMPARNLAPPTRPNLVNSIDPTVLMQSSGLDANKRKQLPLWIREGLERMERQKQKKEEREMLLQAREEKRKLELEAENQLRLQAERDGVILPPARSKFESDSEDDSKSENGSVDGDERSPVAQRSKSLSPAKSRTPTPEPLPSQMTPDEILQHLMLRVRRMMTEILLEVTNEEIEAVARSVYRKAKSAAPAKVIQPTKALTLGLGEYGSDSEDDEKPSGRNKGSDTESDDELQVRIAKKKREYAAQSSTRDVAAARAERRFARWEKRIRGETYSSSSSEEDDTKEEVEKKHSESKAEDSHSVRHTSSLVGAKKDIQVEPEANHTTRNDSSKGIVDSSKGKRRKNTSSSSSHSRSRSRSPSRHRRRDHRLSAHKSSGSSRRSRSRSKDRRRRSKSRSRRSTDSRKKSRSRRSRSSERRSRSRSRDRRRSRR